MGTWKNGSTTTSPESTSDGEDEDDETEEENDEDDEEAEGTDAEVNTTSPRFIKTTCPPRVTPPNTRRWASMNGENCKRNTISRSHFSPHSFISFSDELCDWVCVFVLFDSFELSRELEVDFVFCTSGSLAYREEAVRKTRQRM